MYDYAYSSSSHSINSIKNSIESLVETQQAAVNSLEAAVNNVRSDKATAQRLLDNSARKLVITDDAGRYAALTKAAEGTGNNFTQIVADWTAQDVKNRADRAELQTKYGTREEVGHKAAELHEGINLIVSALKDITPEIDQFDATTKKIAAHNEMYKDKPKLQVSPENWDKYSKFGLAGVGRFLLWVVGYKGPHRAYKVVHEYQKNFGNYFEDARDITERKENEKKLQGEQADKQQKYDFQMGIANHMDSLDRSYRGSEGIARDVRSLVGSLAAKSISFVKGLLSNVPGEDAQNIALATVKIANLTTLESVAARQYSEANSTLQQLQDPVDELRNAVGRVGSETISFSIENVEQKVEKAARTSKASARTINDASDTTDGLTPATAGDNLEAMDRKVKSITTVDLNGNQLALDFSGLKTAVVTKVNEYEAEQARLRRIEQERREREAEAERKRLQDQFNSVTRTDTSNDNNWTPSPSPSRESTSIGIGSEGISGNRESTNIGVGNFGISGR